MAVDVKAFEAAGVVQKEFVDAFSNLPSIVGVGLCLNTLADGPALSVQVTDEPARALVPHTFHDLEVVVDVVGEVKAL
ncbi:hypothetical protein [Peteryoungia ipomoeae]|uniref:Uncharacterized protein n=1 Tax=Peteryoungia ipomoeae TaxID=1210932 RepID=A0A4S8PAF7_9HYPH|nr:hypothetical protein [Peteryoungia ipomoeae]THV24909.1 hypothetical protein FAA97_01465 [Peteryoungia ipomoeae]